MHRLPLTDELKYEFREPLHHSTLLRLSKLYVNRKLKTELKIREIRFEGHEIIRDLIHQGHGLLLAPNHSDHADSALLFELGRSMGLPFYFMATHAIFRGMNRHVLPRIGCFPVDREGTDKRALRKSMEILAEGSSPLVIFPEGEIYRLNDKITPLREGVSTIAGMAARKAVDRRNIMILPVGIKYRFPDDIDPIPWMNRTMGELELRFSWREGREMRMEDRIYRYAAGMLSLKEIEYFGGVCSGSIRERVSGMRNHVLGQIETKLGICTSTGKDSTVPERVKECRRRILESIETANQPPDHLLKMKALLDDLFLIVQLYSYPGDYVQSRPTLERAAEILIKFKQDALGKDLDRARHEVPRNATVYVGEPINVKQFLADSAKQSCSNTIVTGSENPNRTKPSRKAHGALTDYLEARMQELLDRGSPGRPLPGCEHLIH